MVHAAFSSALVISVRLASGWRNGRGTAALLCGVLGLVGLEGCSSEPAGCEKNRADCGSQ